MSQYASAEKFQNGTGDVAEMERAAKTESLFCGLRWRCGWMLGEILAHFGGELLHPGAHVLVESFDNRRNGLASHRFIMGVIAAPDNRTLFRVV